MRYHIIVMSYTLVATVGEKAEYVVWESLVADSWWSEGVERYLAWVKFIFDVNSSERWQSSTEWMSSDHKWSSSVACKLCLNTWDDLTLNSLVSFVDACVNLGSRDPQVIRFHIVKVRYPVLDVWRASKREYNFIVMRVVCNVTEGPLSLIVDLCYTWYSGVSLAGLTTTPTLDEILIAVGRGWIVESL